MYASEYGHVEIVEKLIKHGAKINYRRYDGYNAFICACIWKNEKVIKVLLDNNVDTTSIWDGKTGL